MSETSRLKDEAYEVSVSSPHLGSTFSHIDAHVDIHQSPIGPIVSLADTDDITTNPPWPVMGHESTDPVQSAYLPTGTTNSLLIPSLVLHQTPTLSGSTKSHHVATSSHIPSSSLVSVSSLTPPFANPLVCLSNCPSLLPSMVSPPSASSSSSSLSSSLSSSSSSISSSLSNTSPHTNSSTSSTSSSSAYSAPFSLTSVPALGIQYVSNVEATSTRDLGHSLTDQHVLYCTNQTPLPGNRGAKEEDSAPIIPASKDQRNFGADTLRHIIMSPISSRAAQGLYSGSNPVQTPSTLINTTPVIDNPSSLSLRPLSTSLPRNGSACSLNSLGLGRSALRQRYDLYKALSLEKELSGYKESSIPSQSETHSIQQRLSQRPFDVSSGQRSPNVTLPAQEIQSDRRDDDFQDNHRNMSSHVDLSLLSLPLQVGSISPTSNFHALPISTQATTPILNSSASSQRILRSHSSSAVSSLGLSVGKGASRSHCSLTGTTISLQLSTSGPNTVTDTSNNHVLCTSSRDDHNNGSSNNSNSISGNSSTPRRPRISSLIDRLRQAEKSYTQSPSLTTVHLTYTSNRSNKSITSMSLDFETNSDGVCEDKPRMDHLQPTNQQRCIQLTNMFVPPTSDELEAHESQSQTTTVGYNESQQKMERRCKDEVGNTTTKINNHGSMTKDVGIHHDVDEAIKILNMLVDVHTENSTQSASISTAGVDDSIASTLDSPAHITVDRSPTTAILLDQQRKRTSEATDVSPIIMLPSLTSIPLFDDSLLHLHPPPTTLAFPTLNHTINEGVISESLPSSNPTFPTLPISHHSQSTDIKSGDNRPRLLTKRQQFLLLLQQQRHDNYSNSTDDDNQMRGHESSDGRSANTYSLINEGSPRSYVSPPFIQQLLQKHPTTRFQCEFILVNKPISVPTLSSTIRTTHGAVSPSLMEQSELPLNTPTQATISSTVCSITAPLKSVPQSLINAANSRRPPKCAGCSLEFSIFRLIFRTVCYLCGGVFCSTCTSKSLRLVDDSADVVTAMVSLAKVTGQQEQKQQQYSYVTRQQVTQEHSGSISSYLPSFTYTLPESAILEGISSSNKQVCNSCYRKALSPPVSAPLCLI